MRVLCFFPVLLCAQAALSQEVAGQYIEDRSNKVFGCYCEWSGEGEYGGRTGG